MLCSTFKGTTPSELYERYNDENGYYLLELDMVIAAEISDRIREQHEEANKKMDAKRAVANRDQRRAQMRPKEMGQALEDWLKE